MYAEMVTTARRFALTLAVAGIATLGSVAIAPAASAASEASVASTASTPVVVKDGPNSVVNGKGNGPDAFIELRHGRTPVFFCDAEKEKKQHGKCTPLPTDSPRF